MITRQKSKTLGAVLIILCLCALVTRADLQVETNECGGRRPLHARLWAECELGMGGPVLDESGAQAHGHIQCDGPDAVWCAPYFEQPTNCPVCALNKMARRHKETEMLVGACREMCDAEGGVCAHDGLCHCHPGWTGTWCGGRSCGEHGRYSPDLRACLCEEAWHGAHCEVFVPAPPPPAPVVQIEHKEVRAGPAEYRNGWAEREGGPLACHEGYAGERCTVCAAEAVCVPTHDVEAPYALALIHPSQQTEELLEPDPALTAMYHGRRPFRPRADGEYACDCRPKEDAMSAQAKFVHHFSGAGQPLSKQRYLHDHYEYHYVPRGTVRHAMFGAAFLLIFMCAMLAILLYKYAPGPARKVRKVVRRPQNYHYQQQQQQQQPASAQTDASQAGLFSDSFLDTFGN